MTTSRSSQGGSGTPRGRGLDALFEGSASPHRDVDADLAALLDNEVLAAETGAAPGARTTQVPPSPQPPAASSRGVSADMPAVDPIDVPPSASEAQPVRPGGPSVRPEPSPLSPEPGGQPTGQVPERRLPTTKRFGAIIMDTETALIPTEGSGPESPLPVVPSGRQATPPGPGIDEGPTPLPAPISRSEEQKTIILRRLNKVLEPEWERGLHAEINTLYKQVATEFSSPPANAERALTMLREARQMLLDSPEEYVAAEFRTMQVRAMLDRVKESRRQSGSYGPRILGYESAWLLLFLLGIVFSGSLTQIFTRVGEISGPALLNVYPILNTMFWGGIGGVVGALYTLWWHVSRDQDFDRHYMMWYLVQPLMGLVLGGIIFLIMAGGFLILQVNLADENASTGARLLPYLTAVLAGFRQNFVYDQLERLISLFAPPTAKSEGDESKT